MKTFKLWLSALFILCIVNTEALSKDITINAFLQSDHENVYMHTSRIKVNGPKNESYNCGNAGWEAAQCNILISNATPGVYTISLATDALRRNDGACLRYPIPYKLDITIEGRNRNISDSGSVISGCSYPWQTVKTFNVD